MLSIEIYLDGVTGIAWALDRTKLSYGRNKSTGEMLPSDVPTGDDLLLGNRLVTSGSSHSKFMRCIAVYLTIRAPRYWLQEFSTYKVGTVELSGSTMHTIMKRPLTKDDFSGDINPAHLDWLNEQIAQKNFVTVKANLPEGFMQTRGIFLNYQVLKTMYGQRRSHRLQEWQDFCDWVRDNIPFSFLITGKEPIIYAGVSTDDELREFYKYRKT